jgi:hypothetical protein
MGKKITRETVYSCKKVRCCPGCASMMDYKGECVWICKGCKGNWIIKLEKEDEETKR